MSATDRPARAPCRSCPYRRDVPAGVWAAEEYDKLWRYDGSISDQAFNGALGLFFCHQRDGRLCAGWVGCHDMTDNLAVRLHGIAPEAFDYESHIPLFGSGHDAADHGMNGIDRPDEVARRMVARLAKKLGLD